MSAPNQSAQKWTQEKCQRPVRIANCSGARGDPGYQMLRQATQGDVDFITGDYLAEMNLAENAEAMAAGKHEGFEPTAWDGLQQTMKTLNEKRIKVVVNGGALNPIGLAKKCQALITENGYDLKVAAVTGDSILPEIKEPLETTGKLPDHLDSDNENIHLIESAKALLDTKTHPLVSANAYLGARAIVKGLEAGADIIICGRVSDASPVIGAAWWWHGWSDTSYDALAGTLVAGHLIECSAYVTGSNFSGFYEYDPDSLIDLAFGIAEVDHDGTCVITKHDGTKGMVNEDTVKCQFLYELQGTVYLNSDVKAYLNDVVVKSVGKDRVKVSGIRGAPPPPTTKLALFYRGGFQSQILLNATGYATAQKWALYEKQLRWGLKKNGVIDKLDILEFQIIGTPQPNAPTQRAATTYLRIFAQATTPGPIIAVMQTLGELAMQHFSGFHCSLDFRTAMPVPFLAYYPALYPQSALTEHVIILSSDGTLAPPIDAGHPSKYEALAPRESYEIHPQNSNTQTWGGHIPTTILPLGDIALARSGDKGANINLGIFVRKEAHWSWFRAYMSSARMQDLLGDDWKDEYFIERVEFPNLLAVHFVIYGILGRGVSSASTLDCLGKGLADWIRVREVEVPDQFVADLKGVRERL